MNCPLARRKSSPNLKGELKWLSRKLQVKEAAKKLPYLNKSYCSQIEYVPSRYGYDAPGESKRIGYFPKKQKKKKFVGHKKRKIWQNKAFRNGNQSYKSKQFVRKRNNFGNKDRIEAFKRKYGQEPKCPKGKPLSSYIC